MNSTNVSQRSKVGIERVTIKCDDVREILEHEPALKGKYFFVVPVDEIPSREVSWAGREGQVRKRIYKMCDCYLSSSKNTRTFALAVGQEKQQIEEFGSIKPCIWGSDAHDYERLFEPVDKMYCWIKADLSPEGMRQILCEPADRVIIQPENPSNKDSHHIIHSVLFSDQNFQKEEIVFNDNLTAIIGGKSTGKSILLRQLAYSIDSDQVKTREAGIVELVKVLLQQQQSSIDNIKDEYSVLSEKMNQNDQLSKLSKRILEEKQNLSIAEALEKRLSELNSEISSTIDRIIESANWYFEAHTSYINVVNSVGTRKTTTLKFETTVVWMRTQFIEALTNLLDNRNFSAFRSKYEVDLTNIDPAHYDESFLRNLWTAMAEPQKVGGVSRKNGFDLASVLKKVYGNWYNIHYSVSSGNDKIDSMSPGKKGLVMLELLINLADTACPILIDQPEDDLDNRSVYNGQIHNADRREKAGPSSAKARRGLCACFDGYGTADAFAVRAGQLLQ